MPPVAAEPVGLTYDDVDLQEDDGAFYFQLREGLYNSPEVRGEDVLIPYLDGLVPRPRRPERRNLLLVGQVRGEGLTTDERQAAYDALMLTTQFLFRPYRMPATLAATMRSGEVRTIEARPTSIVPLEQVVGEEAQVSVALESVAPEWTVAS